MLTPIEILASVVIFHRNDKVLIRKTGERYTVDHVHISNGELLIKLYGARDPVHSKTVEKISVDQRILEYGKY